ncbi:ABC transporter, ATP-binding protein [Streptococcus ictaluri 707-05]|uniref:ABC transporter, ATP-binding protein n=1 Tax=Streptococcus ictaluri 707-05 TaxID=764299 RepID=G5K669_9STRE|nr:ABC transporter, ATP-binding protein [Streptococcus ictaluri 707-05]
MLLIERLTLTHRKDMHLLINDLSLVINHGDKVALIGEEGTGKSTLLKAIVRPEEISSYTYQEGRIDNNFNKTAYLPQELTTKELQQEVNDFRYQDVSYENIDYNLLYQLAGEFRLDLDTILKHCLTLKSLSGGERLKIQLIKILCQDPDFLLLDESSNNLDMESLSWLTHFIKKTNKSVLFISHDETLLTQTATKIVHLEQIKKKSGAQASVANLDYSSYKEKRQDSFIKQEQKANKERQDYRQQLARIHRIHQSVEHQLRDTKSAPAGRLLAKK